MNTTEFRRAEALFNTALELPAERREGYLRDACGDNADLWNRLRRMLRYTDRRLEIASPDGPGDAIGPYRLIELVGEGGFGAVYLAEQQEPVRRRVALKVIKLGMDTKRVIARFEAERQALALMDHSGIARVFDAGATDTGRPYFAMEFVDGVPIGEYAERETLSIRQRLELFAPVCHAVEHAHQKGVIHRDLKPSNVLVTLQDGRPAPKVIDFGIAKATNQQLAEATIFTDFKQLVGTPAYMSPEQAEMSGRDVDTRSDIYSLGVLLYELLTGAFPYRVVGNPHDVLAGIRTAEPARPGRYRAGLDDDVQTIVLKCLQKDPARRYQSAGELARDIERYLAGEPIEAKRDSGWYVLRKQLARHRVALGVAVGFIVVLLVSSIVAWSAYAAAERARADATERLRDSYLAQARAARAGDRPGRRAEALAALGAAADIRPGADLRDEAIARLALFDVRRDVTLQDPRDASADGLARLDRVALGDESGRVNVVAVPGGAELARLDGPPMWVRIMRFSPGGRYLAVKYHTGEEAALWVWDLQAPAPVLKLPLAAATNAFAFFDEGRRFAAAQPEATIGVFALPSGRILHSIALDEPAFQLAADAPGRRLAISSPPETGVVIRDAGSGAVLRRIELGTIVYDLDWSRDGRRLAGAGGDHRAYVWDAATGERLATMSGHQGAVTRVFFGAGDELLATSSWDGTSRLWDAMSGRPMLGPIDNWEITEFTDELAMSTDPEGTFAVWRVQGSDGYRRLEATSAFHNIAMAVSPDGLLATAGANGLRAWDLAAGRELAVLSEETALDVLVVSRGGQRVLGLFSGGLRSWPVQRQGSAIAFGEPDLLWSEPGLRSVCAGPEQRRVFACGRSALYVFDLDQRRVAAYEGDPGITEPAISPDARWIFTGTWKGMAARLWDARSGAAVREFPGGHVTGSFSPDGRWLAVATETAYVLLEAGTWRQRLRLDRSASGAARAAAFSPAGYAALCDARSAALLVELPGGRALAHFAEPQRQTIRQLAFTPAGELLMGTPGRTIHAWDLRRIRQHLRELGLDWEGGPPAVEEPRIK